MNGDLLQVEGVGEARRVVVLIINCLFVASLYDFELQTIGRATGTVLEYISPLISVISTSIIC